MLARHALIAGRYELGEALGEGAMGTVWSATHTITRKVVAIKFLKDSTSTELIGRFILEARAAGAVRHPNVVAIHDVLNLDDGRLALVMDYLEGESLATRLERRRTLPIHELASIMAPIVSAVVAVHDAGIVHRDLKPQNIFIARLADGREQPMLLDFGICKLRSDVAGHVRVVTAAGRVLGTPSYMAPEQALARKDVDASADVWALGVILYEALTGRLPFIGRNLQELTFAIAAGPITPPGEIAPVPDEVSRLILQMLIRRRTNRLQDLRKLQEALAGLASASAPAEAQGAGPSARATTFQRADHSSHWLGTTLTRSQASREAAAARELMSPPRSTASKLVALGLVAAFATFSGAWVARTRSLEADQPPSQPSHSATKSRTNGIARDFQRAARPTTGADSGSLGNGRLARADEP